VICHFLEFPAEHSLNCPQMHKTPFIVDEILQKWSFEVGGAINRWIILSLSTVCLLRLIQEVIAHIFSQLYWLCTMCTGDLSFFRFRFKTVIQSSVDHDPSSDSYGS
jgi:hypothetical protein